jgi:hypothetical protein
VPVRPTGQSPFSLRWPTRQGFSPKSCARISELPAGNPATATPSSHPRRVTSYCSACCPPSCNRDIPSLCCTGTLLLPCVRRLGAKPSAHACIGGLLCRHLAHTLRHMAASARHPIHLPLGQQRPDKPRSLVSGSRCSCRCQRTPRLQRARACTYHGNLALSCCALTPPAQARFALCWQSLSPIK